MKKECHILVTFDLSKDAREQVRNVSDRVQLTVIPAEHPEDVSDDRWAAAEVLFTRKVLPQPEKAPNLQWVQFNSAGVDMFLEDPLIQRGDIIATSMSGVITGQVAEYVLMAMLAFGRRLPLIWQHQQARQWPQRAEKWRDFIPQELRHSTVGILGYGSIGRQVARLLQPFGAKVLAAKRDVMHPEDTGYIPEEMGDPHGDFFDRLYPIEALHSMLSECDFVITALPLTEQTHHILDAVAFEAMKETAYLINVGRGELMDQEALIEALKAKKIAGAALDVFEEEPLPEESPLWKLDNVIISPHISGVSRYIQDETLGLFIENLNRYLADLPLYNRIDADRGY